MPAGQPRVDLDGQAVERGLYVGGADDLAGAAADFAVAEEAAPENDEYAVKRRLAAAKARS